MIILIAGVLCMEHSWLFDRHGLQRAKSGTVFGFQVAAKPSRGWMVSSICDPCSASLVNSVQVHGVSPGESKTACLRLTRIQKYCRKDLASKEGEQKKTGQQG